MKSLTREELANLLDVAPEPWNLMFRVTFNHGLRVSEAIGLTGNNLVEGELVLQRLKGSCKTSHPLLKDERDGLLNRAKTKGRLFPISRWTFMRYLKLYGRKAGIPESKLHPHVLKHTCGRLAYLGGMGLPELQRYIGHKVGSNTMIYAQASESEAASAFAAAVGK